MPNRVYQVLSEPADEEASFLCDLRRVEEYFKEDDTFWCRSPARPADADYKLEKYAHWADVIGRGGPVRRPWFDAGGSDYITIMDGRHRMYALLDAGFEAIEATCPRHDLHAVSEKLGVRD